LQQERPTSQTQDTRHREANVPSLWQMVLLAALSLSVLLSSVYAHEYALFPGDLTLELHIQAFDSSFVKQAMKVISQIGSDQMGAALVLIAVLLFFLVKNRRADSLMLVGAGLFSQVYQILKLLVERPRPSPDLVSVFQSDQSSSFPSGHATFFMAFFGTLFYFSSIYIRSQILKRVAQVTTVVFILLIGISRVYLGAHWPSDVVGGYLLGGLILAVLVLLHRRARQASS
jgi:membrane-associated phospholipid phosphatase